MSPGKRATEVALHLKQTPLRSVWALSPRAGRIFRGLVAMAGLSLASGIATAALKMGDIAPDLSGYELRGAVPATKGKVVILDFWASWCGPCKASFPVLGELQKSYGGQGLVVVGVSVDQKASAYDTFLKRMTPNFVTLHDVNQKLVNFIEVPVMPTSYVIDGKGIVRYIHEGFHGEASRQDFIREIELILKETPRT